MAHYTAKEYAETVLRLSIEDGYTYFQYQIRLGELYSGLEVTEDQYTEAKLKHLIGAKTLCPER